MDDKVKIKIFSVGWNMVLKSLKHTTLYNLAPIIYLPMSPHFNHLLSTVTPFNCL